MKTVRHILRTMSKQPCSRVSRQLRPRLELLEGRPLLTALTIAQENLLPGTPESVWDNINGIGDPTIQGFATDMSVNAGQTISFKINDTASNPYNINIYRIGYYQGNGARLVATISPPQTLMQVQPNPITDDTTGMADAGNWAVSASWAVPPDATSGVYVADVIRNDTGGMSQIVFVVRNDASNSAILFKTSDATWQAYNDWGGNNLYGGGSKSGPGLGGAAYAASYNRPLNNRFSYNPDGCFFYDTYPMVRWLEANGYDVTYFTDVDADRHGNLIRNHQIFLSVGHDEYWSGNEFNNVMAARNAGVNLAFFSGNEVFWKTYYAPSIDNSGTPNRTLVCYKETKYNAITDPNNPTTWTGTWADPRFSPPTDGGISQNALTGTLFTVNRGADPVGTPITVPGTYANLRLWRNTAVAGLTPNQSMTIGGQVLGYEWDENVDNGFRPAGLFNLSSTTQTVSEKFVDYGNIVVSGRTATHSLTLYRASSGALVFGAGTVQWSWGLDSNHDGPANPTDVNMQQAMVNLFADMGVQPVTLQSGLVAATASADGTPPTSIITSPTAGAALQSGTPITITGTASDSGGGVVAGVEVSVDGGQTWHPAQGRANWSYTWTPGLTGSVTIKSRAVDDSANLENPLTGVTVTVQQPTGALSIWSPSTVPSVANAFDSGSVEVGMQFRSDINGYITGLRFYKGPLNTGTHVGNLWSSNGTLLASATFTSETASGWQQVSFANPVAITAGTTYVASYHTNVGQYSDDIGYFAGKNADNGPLHALQDKSGSRNGVYQYGPGGFPSNPSLSSDNYWVDVVFTTTAPPSVTAETPAPGASNVSLTTAVTATFSVSVQPSSITFVLKDSNGNTVPASVSYADATRTATLTPSAALVAGTTYTATVSGAKDQAGHPMAIPFSWQFTTVAPPGGPYTIWSSTTTPAVTSANDPGSYELGVKFTSDVAGSITGIRFYKGSGNGGTHVGHLWTASGTLLATATFTGETASGWQQVNFATPVAISPNTTYVASYSDPQGTYAYDAGYFATAGVDNAPLHALANGVNGANGVYGTSGTFPTGSNNNSTNYWVDVVFTSPPATHLTVSAPVSATAGVPFSVTVTALSASNGTAAGYTGMVHFTSSDGLAVLPADYTFTVADAGSHTFTGVTLKTVGGQTVTATDTVTASIHGSATVTVAAPAPATHLAISAPASANGGVPFSVTVTALSASNGTAAGYTGTVHFTSSDSLAVLPANYTFTAADTGSHTFTGVTLKNYGSQTVTVADTANGSIASAQASITVTAPNYSIWNSSATPAVTSANDTGAIELGVKFTSDAAGSITGIRFYKGSGNGGTHVGHLWDGAGNLLATATFTGETASGWQQVSFANPVTILAGTTYVASYYAPQGHYAADSGYFATAGVNNAPLHALADGVNGNGGDGVYVYGTGGTFPTGSFQSTNYWVDVVFTPQVVVTGETPTPNTSYVLANTVVKATFSEAVQPTTISFVLKDQNGNTVPASLGYDSATNTATLTPNTPLSASAPYTATVSGAKGASSGYVMAAPFSWSFTTAPANYNPTTIWAPTATPTVSSANDSGSVELGVKFTSDVDGSITGIRFYKGSGNGGMHVGHLWTASGTLLATATFTGETASGWQQVNFATPVAISANTTYVASYYAPQGHYASDSGYFATAGVDDAPLHALSSLAAGGNGVYAYGTGGTFPTGSYQSTNYWVDVVFNNTAPSGNAPVTTAAAPATSAAAPSTSGPSGIASNPGQQPSKTVKTVQVASSSGSVFAGREFLSQVLDAGRAASWQNVFWNTNLPPGARMVVKIRTGDTPTPDKTWSAWSVVGNGGVIPQASQARYLRYSVSLVSPSMNLLMPIQFAISFTSVADAPVHQPSSTDRVSSSSGSVLAGKSFVSPVSDAGRAATWKAVSWTGGLPPGASLVVEVSTGDTPTPDKTWSAWSVVGNSEAISISRPRPSGRYLRYRVKLLTAGSILMPIPFKISLTSSASPEAASPIKQPPPPLPQGYRFGDNA